MKNLDPLWFPGTTPVWCSKVVSSKGGGRSVLGLTAEEAYSKACVIAEGLGSLDKWWATWAFLVSESTMMTGVWNMTPPPKIAEQITEYTKGRKDE